MQAQLVCSEVSHAIGNGVFTQAGVSRFAALDLLWDFFFWGGATGSGPAAGWVGLPGCSWADRFLQGCLCWCWMREKEIAPQLLRGPQGVSCSGELLSLQKRLIILQGYRRSRVCSPPPHPPLLNEFSSSAGSHCRFLHLACLLTQGAIHRHQAVPQETSLGPSDKAEAPAQISFWSPLMGKDQNM